MRRPTLPHDKRGARNTGDDERGEHDRGGETSFAGLDRPERQPAHRGHRGGEADPVERHGNILEVGHGAQTIDFALVCGDFGIRGAQTRFGAVVIGLLALLLLHGDDTFGRVAPALISRLRELLFGFPDPHARPLRRGAAGA
jgi:hypothetical protein